MGVEAGVLAAYAAVASAAVGVASAVYTGDQNRKTAHRAADQAEADAEAAQGQAMVEAAKIRKAARAQQSTAVAALAASGVDVSAGTAEQIQTDIGQRGEEDALTTILSGGNRSRRLRGQAALDDYSAGQAGTAAGLGVLSSVASSARGWKGTRTGGGSGADLSYTTRGSGD